MDVNFKYNEKIELLQEQLGFTGKDKDGKRGQATNRAIFAAADAGRLSVLGTKPVVASPALPSTPSLPKPVSQGRILQGKNRVLVEEIIIHTSATRPLWMSGSTLAAKVAEIRSWHRANGWNDIGYHWIIDRDGAYMVGRAETTVGAHTIGKNTGTIGVCLLGGHGSAETDQFFDNYTFEQQEALLLLIEAIRSRTPIKKVSGHNEYAAKACPGFSVPRWLAQAA